MGFTKHIINWYVNCQKSIKTGSDVYEVEVTEYLGQAGYDRTVACRIVIEFKEGCGH